MNYKNKHQGETCIIIGNGPSLRDVSNAFLNSFITFGSNRIFLKYVPTYYVCINKLVLEQNKTIIDFLSCEKFLKNNNLNCLTYPKEFSLEPDKWVYEGFTVTFVSMQLAYYMGFTTVLLVGVDHRYKFDGKPNQMNMTPLGEDDVNHFSPEYFKGMFWHNPDLERSALSYGMAKRVFEKNGRKIINLTKDSALDIFEKDDIKNWNSAVRSR